VVYRDATRQAKRLYHLKHVGALGSGLAYLSRYNSGWFCHRGPLGEFGESGEVHPSLADLDHLLPALALVDRVGCLPLEGSPRLRAILDKVGRASVVETTIVVVFLVNWRKTRPWTLLLLLQRLWCRWSIESCLLGWSSYPSARHVTSRRCSGSGAQNQPIP
jgi:hypothetical protein